ncbi:MAG: polyphosphate kinase 1 [Gammaproteobacteria bacterium]|nr:MAG: polyphosphate kinase 1 [Gammaproteobacteria bacterium]
MSNKPDNSIPQPPTALPAAVAPVAVPEQGLKKKARKHRLGEPYLYLNRELSHLQFNQRVLAQAMDSKHPLLERLRFLLIFSSNMDEFFEIRVASLKKQVDFGREKPGMDGLRPQQVMQKIFEESQKAIVEQYRILNGILLPELRKEKIFIWTPDEWTESQRHWAYQYFRNEIYPVVSPLGLDPAHPFPRLVNKSLNFILSLSGKDAFGRESGLAILPVPRSLPRLLRLPPELCRRKKGDHFIYLSAIIRAFASEFFPGMAIKECHQFRVTRNADLEMNDAEVEDIAHALQGELHLRQFGTAVRLEVNAACPEWISDYLLEHFNLDRMALFPVDGQVNLTRLLALYKMLDRPDLCYPAFMPALPEGVTEHVNLFDAISDRDILLHHPYESFAPVVDLVRTAARDPNVLAIKQTLYRLGNTSELIDALIEAARNGKEVIAVIELRARFDEEENMHFASRLQEAGAVVVYGVVGYKTHAKLLMVVRREGRKLKRYLHLATGNYHPGNAKAYTDYGLMTADPDLGNDVHKVFQQITGMGKNIRPRWLLHAPFSLRQRTLSLIKAEAAKAASGKPARIIAKINGLTDTRIIKALYEASVAGVRIDLIVRGMCCLRPGVTGVSDNIRVVSIIGRFLEHSRVFYFSHAEPAVYLSSADWRERNLDRRVEVCFPVRSSALASRIVKELETYLADNTDAWQLDVDGNYQRLDPKGSTSKCAQQQLLEKLGAPGKR